MIFDKICLLHVCPSLAEQPLRELPTGQRLCARIVPDLQRDRHQWVTGPPEIKLLALHEEYEAPRPFSGLEERRTNAGLSRWCAEQETSPSKRLEGTWRQRLLKEVPVGIGQGKDHRLGEGLNAFAGRA